MKIYLTKDFKKAYKRRVQPNQSLVKRFEQRYSLFEENPDDLTLQDHMLSGRMKDYKAFSITGDIRVIYYTYKDAVYFVDIGTHNQVYGK